MERWRCPDNLLRRSSPIRSGPPVFNGTPQILLDFLFHPLRFQGFDNDPSLSFTPSPFLSFTSSPSIPLLEWHLRSNRRKFVRPVAVIASLETTRLSNLLGFFFSSSSPFPLFPFVFSMFSRTAASESRLRIKMAAPLSRIRITKGGN